MADYYPLLSRAIANLATNEIDIRLSIYARARDALDRQLRSLDPALSDADILKEKLALEDVVRRIEQEQTNPLPAEPEPKPEPLSGVSEPAASIPDAQASETIETSEPALPVSSPRVERPRIPPRVAAGAAADAVKMAPPTQGIPKPVRLPEAATPGARISLPDEGSVRRQKSRLGLLAAGGVAAMIGMGALALATREGPERYRPAARIETPPPAVIDPSKQEGRLATVEAPEPVRQPVREAPAIPATPAPAPSPPVTTPSAAPPPPQAATPQPVTPLPILGRAFMILEVPGAPPNQYEGQANWSFVPDTAGKPGEKIVRLQAEFVAAGLSVDFSLSRNMDASLNASHTIFMAFETKAGLPTVKEMSAIEWRERETQSGAPLIGVLVPIQDNAFLIGLDKSDAARARNIDLLQTQKWMVFEVRMGNARRGAFLIEKGSAGDKVIADALSAWK